MKKIFILIIALILTSCASADLYRVTVTQGTVFNQEDIDKLQVGMSKDQVVFILGTLLLKFF